MSEGLTPLEERAEAIADALEPIIRCEERRVIGDHKQDRRYRCIESYGEDEWEGTKLSDPNRPALCPVCQLVVQLAKIDPSEVE